MSKLSVLSIVWGGYTQAGILGGEKLVAVDNMAMESVTRDEAVALLRGPSGSTVRLFP